MHGLGRLYVGNPSAYRPTHELVPYYWWVDNEHGRTTQQTWQADWVQHSAGVIPGAQLAVLPGTTHMGVTKRPEQVLSMIRPFLDAG